MPVGCRRTLSKIVARIKEDQDWPNRKRVNDQQRTEQGWNEVTRLHFFVWLTNYVRTASSGDVIGGCFNTAMAIAGVMRRGL